MTAPSSAPTMPIRRPGGPLREDEGSLIQARVQPQHVSRSVPARTPRRAVRDGCPLAAHRGPIAVPSRSASAESARHRRRRGREPESVSFAADSGRSKIEPASSVRPAAGTDSVSRMPAWSSTRKCPGPASTLRPLQALDSPPRSEHCHLHRRRSATARPGISGWVLPGIPGQFAGFCSVGR